LDFVPKNHGVDCTSFGCLIELVIFELTTLLGESGIMHHERIKSVGCRPIRALCSLLLVAVLINVAMPCAWAQTQGLLRLTQAPPRPLPNRKLPPQVELGPVIPGLRQGAVPQGLAYVAEKDWIVVALDFDGEPASMLGVVHRESGESGKLESSITLLERDGSPHRGHVGGLAVSPQYLWVASLGIYRIPLKAVIGADAVEAVRMQPVFTAEVPGGAATYQDGMLWIAEYVNTEWGRKGSAHHIVSKSGKDSYAWITGYKLDDQDNLSATIRNRDEQTPPDQIITAPYNMQGLAFFKNRLILSTSYGRANASKLYVADNPLTGDSSGTVKTAAGREVPYWDLDAASDLKTFELAPMAEGIATAGDQIALITESGAEKYLKGGKGPLDYVVLISPPDRE